MLDLRYGLPSTWHVKNVLYIGVGTQVGEDVEFGFPDWPIETLYIGDHVTLYGPSRFAPRRLVIGDYTKIYDNAWCGGAAERNKTPGYRQGGEAYIGHCGWFAPRCVMDPTGGFYVERGFAAGHETHLWSHIRAGDTLQGCRFLKYGSFRADADVWFVGRATAMPVVCGARSIAMTSATVTGNMSPNRIYAGTPSIDVTDRLGGPPYTARTEDEIRADFEIRVEAFAELMRRRRSVPAADVLWVASQFDPVKRTYAKTNGFLEVEFMRYLLPEAKFFPEGAVEISAQIGGIDVVGSLLEESPAS